MYVRQFWTVLVVDDEPDIHAISRLALQSIELWGIPLEVVSAKSAEEAKKLLPQWQIGNGVSELAVALIDVVMESDTAGLDLCRHIREDMRNLTTQLVVRTGQPGKAPERSVIDRYDISSYLSKVEATEDRLYAIAKTAVRQFVALRVAQGGRSLSNSVTSAFAAAGRKESALHEAIPALLRRLNTASDGSPLPAVSGHNAIIIGDQVFGIGDMANASVAVKRRDELRAVPATFTGPNGETTRQSGDFALLSLGPGKTSIEMIARNSYKPMPEVMSEGFFGWMTTLRDLISISAKS